MNVNPESFIKQQIEFDCPICSETYDDNTKYPMMLCSSQHSCCLKCVNSIFNKNLDNSECPFCKIKIIKKDVKKFRLLHEIKETASKLKNQSGGMSAEMSKNVQQLQEDLGKEKEKNGWLIQQTKERDDLWIKKLKSDTHEQEKLKSELFMKKFEVQHLKAVIHEQNQRLTLQRIKENSLLTKNIKLKINNLEEHHLPGKFTFENFEIIRKLGKGDYSIVYLAREKRIGFLCALKAVEKWKVKQLDLDQTVGREIKVTSYLDHPNISKVYGHFWDEKFIYIIGQVAVDESLSKTLKKNTKCNVPSIIRQVALAVQQLVAHSIIHTELSCNTVILTFNDVVKLSGFSWVTIAKKNLNQKDNLAIFEGYFNDIRSIALICYQAIHPEKQIKDLKSPQLLREIEAQAKNAANEPNALGFINLILSKSDNPLNLITEILSHPFINYK